MPELTFQISGAEPAPFTAAPALALTLGLMNRNAAEPVHAVMLQCQLRIEAPQRSYSDDEQAGLRELFGEPQRWGTTLKSLLWTQVAAHVPPFTGVTRVQLLVPCTLDLTVGAARYFHALRDGEVPLLAQFSGTVFHAGSDGALQVAPLPNTSETRWRLPLRTWQNMVDQHFPGDSVITLRRDLVARLRERQSRSGLPTLDGAVEELLDRGDA